MKITLNTMQESSTLYFKYHLSDWTRSTQNLLSHYWKLDNVPDFKVAQKRKGYVMKEIASKHLEQFCTSTEANSEYRKSVTTIHSVKGASIGAVLLFLSDNDRG